MVGLVVTRPAGLPAPRGPVSAAIVGALRRPPGAPVALPEAGDDPLDGDDSALALYACYELHYASFTGVDDAWEWDPSLLAARAELERRFEARLRDEVPYRRVAPAGVAPALRAIAEAPGRSLSAAVEAHGTLDELREFAIHRSAYQLKEADGHTFAIPRLRGRAKAALVEIQKGEYGDGDPARVHATLFASTLRALGLDDTYGAYLDRIPGVTLATVNLISHLALHRRHRGALVGHLALFEMCSVTPMGRYARALRRVGRPDAAPFYDEHVVADEHHQVVALRDMAVALAHDEPALAADIVFGAHALDRVESRFAAHLLDAWAAGRSSLLP